MKTAILLLLLSTAAKADFICREVVTTQYPIKDGMPDVDHPVTAWKSELCWSKSTAGMLMFSLADKGGEAIDSDFLTLDRKHSKQGRFTVWSGGEGEKLDAFMVTKRPDGRFHISATMEHLVGKVAWVAVLEGERSQP